MWILGNLFSKNPTILYTIDDKKDEKKREHRDEPQKSGQSKSEPQMESVEHLRKWCGLDY